jgi:hypothetical protein
MAESRTVIEALDRIGNAFASSGGGSSNIEYPHLANGPVERVLAFNIKEHHVLRDADTPHPYFSNQGYFTDLQGRVLPGSRCETSLAIDPSKIGETYEWPPAQPEPFDQPPSIFDHTDPLGHSKQAYFFGDGSSLVTTGPSVPKILRLKGGGAHLWVASAGVIAQGTGKYEGARGLSSYIGCAHFPFWPQQPADQLKVLAAGFEATITAYFKLVLKADIE